MKRTTTLLMALSPKPRCKGTCASYLVSSLSPLSYSYSTATTCVPPIHEPSNGYQRKLLQFGGTRLHGFLQAHCRTGFNSVQDALILFRHMTRLRPLPDALDFNRLLSGVVRMKEYSTAAALFNEMLLLEGISSSYCWKETANHMPCMRLLRPGPTASCWKAVCQFVKGWIVMIE